MPKLDDDIDSLFQLPLTEFISARKTLAARLKKEGRADDAERIKLLAKPSVSAWAVNQLYWRHRQAFDRLLTTGQRFHKAQKSGKVTDMRDALDARREALSQLSDLATSLLRQAGNNPSLDTVRRVTTSLEAISAYATLSDGPTAGRLMQDVDPPGFESFASFAPSTAATKNAASTKRTEAPRAAPQKDTRADESRRLEQSRQAKIGAVKIKLQNAKKSLTAARAEAQEFETAKKKADAALKDAEKNRRETEERFKKANVAYEAAAERSRNVKIESETATQAFDDAKQAVDDATKELESLFREKP